MVGHQLVGGPDPQGVGVGPARQIVGGQPSHLVVGDPGPTADHGVLAELVLAAAAPAHPQDQQLPLPFGQRALGQDVTPEHQPPLQRLGVVGQRGEDVQPAQGIHQLVGLVVPLRRRGRRQSRCGARRRRRW